MPAIFEKIDKIKPAYDITYKVVMFICKILLIADILITSMSVAGRYIPFIPDPAWILAVIMITVGWKYASGIGSKGTYVSMPKVSRFWMYFPVPLAGVAMLIFELEALYNHIKVFFVKEEA